MGSFSSDSESDSDSDSSLDLSDDDSSDGNQSKTSSDSALSELGKGRAAFSESVAANQGVDVIACIDGVGTLSGHVTEARNGTVIIEFGAMAAATAARPSECAARTY